MNLVQWNGDWIGTNTGNVIELNGPRGDQISIEDIATGLANNCRFTGQLKMWYSVAEHSLHVAELVPEQYKLAALLHDASEAYICDVATPFKRMLGDAYRNVERAISDAIGRKFGVDLINLPDLVKQADQIMLVTERDALQDKPQDWGPAYDQILRYPKFRCQYSTPSEARRAFLAKFYELAN